MLPPTSNSLLQHLKQLNYWPSNRVETCVWSDARHWTTWGSWMGERRRAFCIIASHKSTITRKPVWAKDVQVQNFCLLEKLLLHQQRTWAARKGATAWQTMKHAKIRMFWLSSVNLKKSEQLIIWCCAVIFFKRIIFLLNDNQDWKAWHIIWPHFHAF